MQPINSNTNAGVSSSYPFSEEIPELLQTHLDHLKASGITIDVIRERGYKSVLGKKSLQDAGFSKAQQRAPGILIPLHGVDSSIIGHQYRPDHPREDPKRGRVIKYENPTGSSVRLDVPPRCREQLGDPSVPIFFTEGIKKDDALASQGACAVGLTGVWGFKGKNVFGGIAILADFDYIAFKDRLVYLVFDSDSMSNPHVAQALNRLAEHLRRKGAEVRIVKIPAGPNGEKVGVDNYLHQGHTIKDLIALADETQPIPPLKKIHQGYTIEEGKICWLKPTQSGEVLTALCNFDAKVTEDIIKDSGIEQQRFFVIEGRLSSNKRLPKIQVPANRFNSINWVNEEWGIEAIIAAGMTLKDRLREAIQLQSQDAIPRRIYTHTGWREVEGTRCFLTANGALGLPAVEVELDSPLQRYQLPLEATSDIRESIMASLGFLDIGKATITVPLWAAMYLAPLSEVLNPAFTLWQIGPTGAFKSTIQALALSHYGKFTVRSLPASWRDTANFLEKLMALAKDIPLVIDDFAPPPDVKQSRELEFKAELVARAQGNRLGRGRLRSDTSTRPAYIPRGVVVTNGEQIPRGHSHSARLFTTELEPGDIDMEKLTAAQELAVLYPIAMAAYIQWLSAQLKTIEVELPKAWDNWRHQAQIRGQHPRVPEAIAWLYAGFDMAMAFAEEIGVFTDAQAQEWRNLAWDALIELGNTQWGRVEEERPARRFLEGLKSLMDEGRVVFQNKDEESAKASLLETPIGWYGEEGLFYLNPGPVHSVVYDFCRRSGEPLTFRKDAIQKDLRRLGLTVCDNGRTTGVTWVSGKSRRVIKLKTEALNDV